MRSDSSFEGPVCDGGINWQRNRLVRAARAGAMEFRDVDLEPAALAGFGRRFS